MLTALFVALFLTLAYAGWLTFRVSSKPDVWEVELGRSPETADLPPFEEITLERGEDKTAFVFRGRRIGRTPGGHIHIMEAEDGFYVITNGYLYPEGIYSFAFPSELKGHIRLTKEIIELFRSLKKYNAEFGEVVEERLENPLLKEFITRKEEVPVKVISRRIEDGEVPNTQRNDAEMVRYTQGKARELEDAGG